MADFSNLPEIIGRIMGLGVGMKGSCLSVSKFKPNKTPNRITLDIILSLSGEMFCLLEIETHD